MEKPGPRPRAHPTSLIIDRPDLQSWQQRLMSRTLTLVFWGLWFYLWLPVVTLAGWWLGIERFRFHMIALEGYVGFIDIVEIYLLIILALSAALIGWAKYNHIRFRGVERRRERAAVSIEAIAKQAGTSAHAVGDWRQARIAIVHHDDHGGIASVSIELDDRPDSGGSDMPLRTAAG